MFTNSKIANKVSSNICLSDIHQIKSDQFNPFAPEPPLTARADPGPFYPLWRHQF